MTVLVGDEAREFISRETRAAGEDPILSLATAWQESGWRSNAVGDAGCSHGWFQSNQCGGAGTGIDAATLQDPGFNVRQWLERLSRGRAAHPDVSPGELAAIVQRPADPVGYAHAVNAHYARLRAELGETPAAHPEPAALGIPDVGAIARDVAGDAAAATGRAVLPKALIAGGILLAILVVVDA